MSYFIFKLTLEDDRSYAFENLENYRDFSEFRPIVKVPKHVILTEEWMIEL